MKCPVEMLNMLEAAQLVERRGLAGVYADKLTVFVSKEQTFGEI